MLRVQVLGQRGEQQHAQGTYLRDRLTGRGRGRGEAAGQGEGRGPAEESQLGVVQGLPGELEHRRLRALDDHGQHLEPRQGPRLLEVRGSLDGPPQALAHGPEPVFGDQLPVGIAQGEIRGHPPQPGLGLDQIVEGRMTSACSATVMAMASLDFHGSELA